MLQAQRMNLKLQTNSNKCWKRVWWVCVHRQLSPPRVQPTLCAQQVSRRTHSRAPDARTFFLLLHLGECRASFDAPPPPLRPFYPVSWELIYVSLMSQHVRLDPSSLFASFFLHHRRGGREHILSTICFSVLWFWLKPPLEAKREGDRGRCRGSEVGHRRASLNKEALCRPPTVSDWQSALQHATAACSPKHC